MSYATQLYTATAGQTLFTVPFPYLVPAHVIVNVNSSPTTAFTFDNATTIRMNTPMSGGESVAITRNSSRGARLVNYNDGADLTESIMDLDANQLLYIIQEAFDVALSPLNIGADGNYDAKNVRITNVATGLGANDAVTKAQLDAAVLGGASLSAASITNAPAGTIGSTNVQAAINELDGDRVAASAAAAAAAGTVKVSSGDTTASTLDNKLVAGTGISLTKNNAGANETFTIANSGGSFATGMTIDFFGGEGQVPSGWVICTGTIGSAASGATTRANADTLNLYTQIWGATTNTECAVSGGRGVSAGADFVANKTIALPDCRGRVRAARDNMGGTPANRLQTRVTTSGQNLGATGGAQEVAQAGNEVGAHVHQQTIDYYSGTPVGAVNTSGSGGPPYGAGGSYGGTALGPQYTLANAAAAAHNNTQPTILFNPIIKL